MTPRERLQSMTAASTEPTLSEAELDELLVMSALPDVDGALPTDDDWVPTYDLNRGAAEGWRWKAAKVATHFDFSQPEGQNLSRSQKHKAMLEMADRYAKRIAASVDMGSRDEVWGSVSA